MKLLIDENISPLTAKCLEDLGNDVKTVFDFNLAGSEDEEVAEKAMVEGRALITLDASFGYRYYFLNRGNFGVILLRLSNLSVENVNLKLRHLFESTDLAKENILRKLIVVRDDGFTTFN